MTAAEMAAERFKQEAEHSRGEIASLKAELAAVSAEARRAQTTWSQQLCTNVKDAIQSEASRTREESRRHMFKLGQDVDKVLEELRGLANT